MKILDCTLRDGGYYTNWDFESAVVETYIRNLNALPVDYIELGYRNKPKTEYLGQFGYCPVSTLKHIRTLSEKKLAIMLNEKDCRSEDLDLLLAPIQGIVDMVRMAVDPKNFERAIVLANAVRAMGFEVAFNTMYMSTWSSLKDFYPKLSQLNEVANLFCMVDSFGSMTPESVKETIQEVRQHTDVTLGFHGHNNLQLALINSLTALEQGAEFVDATILGMGRGAGNLNMELLLTYLNKHKNLYVDFNKLGDVIQAFEPLLQQYNWGTNLPYMLSGANSIPQKEVMEMVCNRVYSFNSIVRNLQNRTNNGAVEKRYPIKRFKNAENVIIVGGGKSPIEHLNGIKSFISSLSSVVIVFATARHAAYFESIDKPKYFCLSGKEGKRLSDVLDLNKFKGECIVGPYPQRFGTEVPEICAECTYELRAYDFATDSPDSCTAISIQAALEIQAKNVYVIGYDGYPGKMLSERDMALNKENESLFRSYRSVAGKKLISLTPTAYDELDVQSIYQMISNN